MRESSRRRSVAAAAPASPNVAPRRRAAWTSGLLALALLAAAAWFANHRESTPAPADDDQRTLPTRFAWQQGLTRAYRVRLQAEARIDFAGFAGQAGAVARPASATPAEAIELSTEGRLWLRSFAGTANGDGSTPVVGVLVAPRYRVDGEELDAAALTPPFLVDIDDRGRLANLRTVDGLPDHALAVLRSLLDALQFVLPEQPATQWSQLETLDDDPLRTSYRRQPQAGDAAPGIGVIKRSAPANAGQIGSRDQPSAPPAHPPGLSPAGSGERDRIGVLTTAHDIDATVIVSPDPARWLLAVDLQASILRHRGGREVGRTRYTVSARSLGEADIARGDAALPASLQQALAALREPWQDPALLAEGRRLLASLGANPSAAEVAALYAGLQASRFVDVEEMLLAWLRDQPERADALLQFLRTLPDKALTQDAELSLWRLLARAGTAESQAAMLAALADPGFGEQAQLRAAMHLGEIADPSADTLDRLLAFSASLDADATGHQRMLANTALLAAGALAGPRTIAVDDNGRMLADAVADRLNQRFLAATAPSEQRAVLAAIGNQGHVAGLATIELALAADDAETRALAYRSLRHMPAAAASELLQAGFDGERDPQVQVAALATLAGLPPSRQSLDWAHRLLQQPADPRVTRALVDVLGNARQAYPDADAALRELLQQHPPRDVRAAIHQHLGAGG